MSNETKFLVPKAGLLIRDPVSKNILPAEGAMKPWIGPEGRYWRRRVNDGSCSEQIQKKTTKVVAPIKTMEE